jgi:5-methylcytosine-specific restriction endonuclease McrA
MDRKTHGHSAYLKRQCRCEICTEARRVYCHNTKERRLAYARKYRAENLEKCLESQRLYREANPDRFKNNTPARRIRHRELQAVRRARMRDTAVEYVDYRIVFETANYRCQACGITCPEDAVFPARDFPSLDHIVPLSKGGSHTYENTQCLCLGCNLSKGAKHEERLASVQ